MADRTGAVYNNNGKSITVRHYGNGKYYNNYGWHITAGSFSSFEEAETMLYKHRPQAEEYASIIYDKDGFVIIRDIKSGLYSFGSEDDLYSFLGFFVDDSFLTAEEFERRMNLFIEIDKAYIDDEEYYKEIAITNIKRWHEMIAAVKEA